MSALLQADPASDHKSVRLDEFDSQPRPVSPAAAVTASRPYLILFAIAIAAGSLALLPILEHAAHIWQSDPLRSIGAAFPILALAGTLRAWRREGWRITSSLTTTLIGLSVTLLAIVLGRMIVAADLTLHVGRIFLNLRHGEVALFLYASGATLCCAGPRVLRRSLAPLVLLLLLNPVPYVFNSWIDLPLQQSAAKGARAFAHLIGLAPTGEQLRLMFTPDFGMLIVPGCNGLRGAITLFYLTLVFGYTRRVRPLRLGLAAIGALLSGYLLNLLRLCVLVLYYRAGMVWPAIQPYGVGVDYAIGCTLFLLATAAVGVGIRQLEPARPATSPGLTKDAALAPHPSRVVWFRLLAFATLAAICAAPQVRRLAAIRRSLPDPTSAAQLFPTSAGSFRLLRTYEERDVNGNITMALADYADVNGRRLTLGMWLGAEQHLVARSRLFRGERLETRIFQTMPDPRGRRLPISLSFFNTGVSHVADAETICSVSSCTAPPVKEGSAGILFAVPSLHELAFPSADRQVPVVLEREWIEPQTSAETLAIGAPDRAANAQFQADAGLFLQQVDLPRIVARLGNRP